MPALSHPSHLSQSSSIIPVRSSSNTPSLLWNLPLIRPVFILLFIIGIPCTLILLLRRVIGPQSAQSRCLQSRNLQQDWKQTEILESSWPPASFVAMSPESNNLPSPTIRRNSPSADMMPSSPRRTSVPKMKTWPVTDGLLRRELMEEMNGCRRHVVVFGKQG